MKPVKMTLSALLVLALTAESVTWGATKARNRDKSNDIAATAVVTAEAGTAFERAIRMLKSGRIAEAKALLLIQLKDTPAHLDARRLLVQLLWDAGLNAEAEEQLAEAQNLSPQSLDVVRALATMQAERGANALALASLEKSRQYASEDAEYLAFMANICQRLAQHDKANALLENALALKPGEGQWLYAQWISRRALGDMPGASESAEKALATKQLSKSEARQLLNALKFAAGASEEAEQSVEDESKVKKHSEDFMSDK